MRRTIWLPVCLLTFGCSDSAQDSPATTTKQTAVETGLPQLQAAPSGTYDEALAKATAAIETAIDNNYAWNTSTSLIKDAKSAAADGDEAKAIMLADEARMHADLAAIQAAQEADKWQDAVISD